jgi:hypothetical protein
MMVAKESDVDRQLEKLNNDPRMATNDEKAAEDAAMHPAPAKKGLLSFLNPKNWHPAVSLALAAAAIAQAGLLVTQQQESGQQIAQLEKRVGDLEYQLASGPGERAGQADILVQVKPEASWAALSELLANEGLTIVAGPSDNTLSLSSELEGAALDALILRLRASALIEAADKAA